WPATSGTPRPLWPPGLADGGIPVVVWYVGTGKKSLTPPPPALLVGFSFHTVSLVMVVPETTSLVPPHPSANGLEAGKSTCALPSVLPSPHPLSPAAQRTVTPHAAPAGAACSAGA